MYLLLAPTETPPTTPKPPNVFLHVLSLSPHNYPPAVPSSDNVSLHQMLTVCNGGLGWAERIDGVGRDRVRVKVLKTTSACHCWVQLVDSYEVRGIAYV